jgi:hypothetical protein
MREPQRWWVLRWQATLAAWLVILCIAAAGDGPAQALMKYGPIQLSGNVESQELIRTPNIDTYQFIQNRNTFRLRVDFDWLQDEKFLDTINVPFIQRSKLFLLYRGVYDGFYGIAPGDLQRGQTRYDDFIGGKIGKYDSSRRTNQAFENDLREAYIDLKLANAPVSFRLGKQQVIWGESDQFRIMDIWNPLDVTWHFQQESWDNIRIPLWLLKGLWDIGDLGPLSNTFLEVVYNPGDFHTGIEVGFLPLPWALPFPDPLRAGQIINSKGALLSPTFNLQGTSYQKGDFKSNPADASEIGARFHAVTPQGIEFSINYLYARGRGVGAASPFGVRISSVDLPALPPPFGRAQPIGTYQVDANNPASVAPVFPVNINAKIIDPYMHIFGLTGNYFEGDFTEAVLRMETAYVLGEPYQTIAANSLVPVTVAGKNVPPALGLGTSPLGYTTRDIWTGMVGFDRPTWIRWLNSKATWFISGQFFWNYVSGKFVDDLRGSSGAGDSPYFGPIGVWKTSTISSTASFPGNAERQQDGAVIGNGDQIRRWEHLVTLAATSFYRGGTVVPFIADAWDPVDDNNEVLWNVDYYLRNDLIINVGQKFFFTYGSTAPSDDPWFAGGRFARRDEATLRVTYQF